MNGYETTDGRLDVPKFEMALQDLETGTLGPVERDELMALVKRSPAAQKVYLGYFEISAMLQAEASIHAEQGNLPKIVRFAPPSQLFRRALLAAAALVMLAALVGALFRVARPEVSELALTATADTRWSVTGRVRDAKGQTAIVREGSSLRVSTGTLELRLESGAAMVLQGPAHVSFPKLDQPVLRSGWLWIDSGASGEKFEIHTPDLRIRNVGTRFGVQVPSEGHTEVHLIRGKLEVFSEAMPEKTITLTPDKFGLAIPSQGEPTQTSLARDPFPDIAGLLAAPANYSTTVLGQNPAAYWRIDENSEGAPGGILQNQVKGEPAGRARTGKGFRTQGPGPAEGFDGFDEANQAARLDGKAAESRLSLGAAPPRHDGLLFKQVFKGEGPLHQRKPDFSSNGASWVAAHRFRANGWISSGTVSATLAFQPVDGVIYTLEGSFRDVSSPHGDLPWVAIGFAGGQSKSVKPGDRFISGEVTGRSWMLFRANDMNLENTTHDVGDSNPEPWANWNRVHGGDIDMRIVLDTTLGHGNWTATYFARRPGKGDYVKVGGPRTLPNEAIRSVGIAVSGDRIHAKVTDFSLQADAVKQDPATSIRAEGPSRLLKSEGAVSCWVRREAGSTSRSILWSAGQDSADNFVNVRLEADGRVGLFIENGRYDVLLTSEDKLAVGRWHHLTASWSPNSTDLYLDGRLIAWQRESREMLQGFLPELQVGGGLPGNEIPSFTGDIDEFAIWDRSLKHAEIEQQFRSGKVGETKNAQ
jgi:ferric-dicitrate binding protein FerR (iron transport regulator)